MKLILLDNEFYLLSHEHSKVGEYCCRFAVGLRGYGRGWSNPKIYNDSTIDRLSKLMQKEHVGNVIASSVKLGDLPLIDIKQITDGDNFVSYMSNLDRFNVNKLSLEKFPAINNDNISEIDENEKYRDIWISAFNKGKSVNYDEKFTKKQMYDLAFDTYLNTSKLINPHAISDFINNQIKLISKEKNEWNAEIETKFNCGVMGITDPPNGSVITGGEACFRQWEEPKISDNGYVNIIKIN